MNSVKKESQLTIGILGGGQLGQMICNAARNLGHKTIIFSDIKNCPASLVSDKTIIANYDDYAALKEFSGQIDVATLEFENIPTKTIDFVNQFKPIFPNSKVLKTTQNRLTEKNFLNQIGIKTTNYHKISTLKKLTEALKEFKYKAILKTATMGYDGKGQKTLNKNSNLEEIWSEFANKELILEKFAPFEQEISIMVARDQKKRVKCWDPLTNIHKNNILHQSIYPAKISKATAKEALNIATKIAHEIDLIGVMGVEFFVLDDNKISSKLLVNELAPRPHNSGHFSMDASKTSQFEQLIYIITNMKMGDTEFTKQGYMQNLIGKDIFDANNDNKNPLSKVHLYGKSEVKEGRKMGHINFLQN